MKRSQQTKCLSKSTLDYLGHHKPGLFQSRFKFLAGYPATVVLVKLVKPVNKAKPVILNETKQYAHPRRHFLKENKTLPQCQFPRGREKERPWERLWDQLCRNATDMP